MTLQKGKVRCVECGWRGHENEMLLAPNPFDATDTVAGCPKCKSVDSLVSVCDEVGCDKDVNCGWPSGQGYRNTCIEHTDFFNEGESNGRERSSAD